MLCQQGLREVMARVLWILSDGLDVTCPPSSGTTPRMLLFHPSEDTDGAVGLGWDLGLQPGLPPHSLGDLRRATHAPRHLGGSSPCQSGFSPPPLLGSESDGLGSVQMGAGHDSGHSNLSEPVFSSVTCAQGGHSGG